MLMMRISTSLSVLLFSLSYLASGEILIRTTTVSEDGQTSNTNDWVPLSSYYDVGTSVTFPSRSGEFVMFPFQCYLNFNTEGNFYGLERISRIEAAVELEKTQDNHYEPKNQNDYDFDGMIFWQDSTYRCLQDTGNKISASLDIDFDEWGEDKDSNVPGLRYLNNDPEAPIQVQHVILTQPVPLQAFRVLDHRQREVTQQLYAKVTQVYADYSTTGNNVDVASERTLKTDHVEQDNTATPMDRKEEAEENKGAPTIEVDININGFHWKNRLKKAQTKELGYVQESTSLLDRVLNKEG